MSALPIDEVTIVERATTTTYDLLVLLFTVMKTAQARKTALSLDIHPSIMTLLLRDGEFSPSVWAWMKIAARRDAEVVCLAGTTYFV